MSKSIQVYSAEPIRKILKKGRHCVEGVLVDSCNSGWRKNNCIPMKRCACFFSQGDRNRNRELAELEGITPSKIERLRYSRKYDLIKMYEQQVFKKCRKIIISVENA